MQFNERRTKNPRKPESRRAEEQESRRANKFTSLKFVFICAVCGRPRRPAVWFSSTCAVFLLADFDSVAITYLLLT
jgi:hypothetical protein